jgi:hypothetical protein
VRRFCLSAALVCAVVPLTHAVAAPPGAVNQRGDGWPTINGLLLMNSHHDGRPLDARPGHDPFMGTDHRYLCDGVHQNGRCLRKLVRCAPGRLCVSNRPRHNELLGGHGNDTIFAGPFGDVIWGDFIPGGPSTQIDRLTGGAGRDFIYGSKGTNYIDAGPGNDFIKSRYGGGRIDCGPGRDILYTSRRYRKNYKIVNCERRSVYASPGQGGLPSN